MARFPERRLKVSLSVDDQSKAPRVRDFSSPPSFDRFPPPAWEDSSPAQAAPRLKRGLFVYFPYSRDSMI